MTVLLTTPEPNKSLLRLLTELSEAIGVTMDARL